MTDEVSKGATFKPEFQAMKPSPDEEIGAEASGHAAAGTVGDSFEMRPMGKSVADSIPLDWFNEVKENPYGFLLSGGLPETGQKELGGFLGDLIFVGGKYDDGAASGKPLSKREEGAIRAFYDRMRYSSNPRNGPFVKTFDNPEQFLNFFKSKANLSVKEYCQLYMRFVLGKPKNLNNMEVPVLFDLYRVRLRLSDMRLNTSPTSLRALPYPHLRPLIEQFKSEVIPGIIEIYEKNTPPAGNEEMVADHAQTLKTLRGKASEVMLKIIDDSPYSG